MSSQIKFNYKYKTISIKHLNEMQEDIDKLYREGKLSNNETYRNYLSNKKFETPESLPNAKNVIVIAIFTKLGLVNFQLDGKKHEIMVPPQYYDDGITCEDLDNLILNKIIKEPGYKFELAEHVHLKLMAVRSGLGKYGRNNLCYVDEWGSLITLLAYFTDFPFKEDNWTELEIMDICKECRICMNNCPSKCITKSNFVIDVGKCVTLYNEIAGEFPTWISPDAHNALIGCMKCQLPCPANHKIIKQTEKLEDISEQETEAILKGKFDNIVLDALCKKLKYPITKEFFPILKRNLEVLIKQT
ncbi:MAG: 4Fe-4S double cluster binding domain-containing protein [Promethearchaeota archaeon]